MKRFTIGAAAALLLSACSMGQDVESPDAALDLPDVADGTLSEETMKRVTERLSSDEFEGRAPGTAGEEKTIAYLIEEFGKAGLEPGNNGSWVQDVPLVEITGKDFAAYNFWRRQWRYQAQLRHRLGRCDISRRRGNQTR